MQAVIKIFALLLTLVIFNSCRNKLKTIDSLSGQDISRLHALQLLHPDEQLFQFYSEYKNSVAGNFYSNKRIASYWLDEQRPAKSKVVFACYEDIIRIDTVYYAGATYSPYMKITKTDSSNFKVFVDGSQPEIAGFFNGAIGEWQRARHVRFQNK